MGIQTQDLREKKVVIVVPFGPDNEFVADGRNPAMFRRSLHNGYYLVDEIDSALQFANGMTATQWVERNGVDKWNWTLASVTLTTPPLPQPILTLGEVL